MVYQDLLCKDYRKTSIATVFRFTVILSNCFIFQAWCGWKEEFLFSKLNTPEAPAGAAVGVTNLWYAAWNSIALVLAIYLTLRSLSFGRPDIDSFNETIYLPAQDKNMAFVLFGFCLLKAFFQWFQLRGVGALVPHTKEHRDMVEQQASRNLILILSSLVSCISSMFYKYEMSNAEKEMVIKINNFLSVISKVAICTLLGVITFYQENGLFCLVFLFVILIDIFRAITRLYGKKKEELKIKDYIVLIKWASFFSAASLALYRPLIEMAKISKPGDPKNTWPRMANGFYGIEPQDPIIQQNALLNLMITVFLLIMFSCMLELIDKLKIGASFEIFDIHMIENLEFDPKIEYYQQKEQTDEVDEVAINSYVINYFISKVFMILQIGDGDILTRYFNFKYGFIKDLGQESSNILSSLNNVKTILIKSLNKKRQYFSKVLLLIKMKMVMYQILSHMELILRLSINIYSAYSFLFFLKKPKFYSVLRYSLLVWNILSMVSQSKQIMIIATIVLIYPFYFIDFVQIKIMKFLNTVEGSKIITNDTIDDPFTSTVYFYLITLISIYLAFLLLTSKDKEEKGRNRWKEYVERYRVQSLNDSIISQKALLRLSDFLESKIFRIYRFIPITLAILTALHSISLLNMILFIITLIFLWKPELDSKYWVFYNTYIIFLMVVKHICFYSLDLYSYNVELLGIVGFITIEEQASDSSTISYLMMFNLLVVYFSCGWYKLLHNYQNKTDRLKKQSTIRSSEDPASSQNSITKLGELGFFKGLISIYQFFSVLTQYYSIWIFHICSGMILLTDTRDLMNVVLLVVETVLTFIHIVIWNRKGDHPYRKIYNTWIIMFYLIIIYALVRYLLFFIKFSLVNQWREMIENETIRSYIFESVQHLDHANVHRVSTYINAYFHPLILLTLAVFTRESFKRYFTRLALRPIKLQTEFTAQDVPISQIRNSFISALTNRNVLDLNFSRDTKSTKRKVNPFVVSYLIFKGLFLALIMRYFYVNMNILKVMMIFFYLINMRNLFNDLIILCNQMQIMRLFSLRSRYFFLTFLTGRKWKVPEDIAEDLAYFYDHKTQKVDLSHNKEYYNQFLVRMEAILFNVNRLFWGLTFFPLLILSGILLVMNFFLTNPEVVSRYYLDVLTGIGQKDWRNLTLINSELIGIQMVIIGLLFEYMCTTYYMDCSSPLVELKEEDLQKLLSDIEIKYRFFLDLRLGRLNKDTLADRLQEFQLVMTAKEKQDKQSNPKPKSNEQEDPDGNFDSMNEGKSGEEDQSLDEEEELKSDTSSEDNTIKKSALKDTEKTDDDPDDYENDGFGKLKKQTGEKAQLTVYYMTESISKEEMLLFLHKNKYKYYYITCLEGLLYSISRLSLLPLFYSTINNVNVFTIGFYVYFCIQSLKYKKLFIDDIRDKNLLVMILLMLQTLHLFVHERLYNTDNPVGSNYYKSAFDYVNPRYQHLFRPINDTDYIMTFFWLFVNGIAFAILPIFIWTTTKMLFREKLSKKHIFHFYLFDQQRKRNIIIDYKKWKSSGLKFLNLMYKTAYINSIELHSFTIVFLILMFYKQLYTPVFIYTLAISIYEHFKIDNKDTKKIVKSEYLKQVLKIYILILVSTIFLYHVIHILAKLNFFSSYTERKTQFLYEYNAGILPLILIVITLIFQDFATTDTYFSICHKMKQESNLKIKFANLSNAYDINEDKIYNRIINIMAKKHIDDISSQILERKDPQNIFMDPNYSNKCILQYLERSSRKLIDDYMSFFRSYWLYFLNNFYKFLINNSNRYRAQDILFLYNNIRLRNRVVLEDYDVNLEQYFELDNDILSEAYDKTTLFYNLLSEGDPTHMKVYEKGFKNFMDKHYSNTDETDNVLEKKEELEAINQALTEVSNNRNRRGVIAPKLAVPAEKKRENLISAMEILANVLTTKYDLDSKSLVDNFKVEFQKRGSLPCVFGKMKVILYNIQNDDIIKTLGYNTVRFRTIFSHIWRLLTSNSEYIISFVLIAIHILYGGFFNIVVIGLIIFTIFIEETSGRSFWWKILYIIYLFMIIFKRTYKLLDSLSDSGLAIEFLLSDVTIDIVCILLVMYMIEFLRKYGVDNKSAVDFENPAVALARLTINQDFEPMIDRICSDEIKKAEHLNLYLNSNLSMTISKIGIKDFKMICIKQVIKNYRLVSKFKGNFLYYAQILMRKMKYDYLKIGTNQFNSFLFRNFSTYMRKSGRSFMGIISLLFLSMIIYILMYFPTVSYQKTRVASILYQNSVTSFTLVNFAVYLSFFLAHYYIDQMKSHDVKGLNMKDYTITLMDRFDVTISKNEHSTAVEKFRKAVNKVKNVMVLCLNFKKEQDPSSTYRTNPLLYMYLFSMVVWIYLNLTVFFWHSTHGNFYSSQRTGLDKYICTEMDQRRAENDDKLVKCRNFKNHTTSQVFYTMNILYLFFCMLQIKYGKPLRQTKINDFSSMVDWVLYKIYSALPLIRETQCTFDYCATKTTLFFSDYILLKEIEFFLHDAKIENNTNMGKKTGEKLSRVTQYSLCIVFISILIGILMVPMYLFYNKNNSSVYPIQAASINIDFVIGKDQKFGDLFEGNRLKYNREMMNPTTGEKDPALVNLFQIESLRKYSASRFYKVQFSKYSDKFLTFTPKMMLDMKEFIARNNDVSVRIRMTFDVRCDNSRQK